MPLPNTATTNVNVNVDTESTTLMWPPLVRFHAGGLATQITRTVFIGTPPPGSTTPGIPYDSGGNCFVALLGADIGYPPDSWRINAWHGIHLQPVPIPGGPEALHANGYWRESGLGLKLFNGRTGGAVSSGAFLLATITGFVSLEQNAAAS